MFGTKVHVSLKTVICTDSAASVGSTPPEECVGAHLRQTAVECHSNTKNQGRKKKYIVQII